MTIPSAEDEEQLEISHFVVGTVQNGTATWENSSAILTQLNINLYILPGNPTCTYLSKINENLYSPKGLNRKVYITASLFIMAKKGKQPNYLQLVNR